ncbi:hypothetical protein [Haloarcula nitratireducens]|uniref:DUF8151 domain-containing protein n=1 Tax=Haloarcula nitratireducens TaxID=2487749 RepID=A0AAW4PBL0_9EURY|nr:hypothetical protein [Halomicroarcula nitratireducens]MBX0295274.1 hypothetical protein [Halomicroarcula nitratireducens]
MTALLSESLVELLGLVASALVAGLLTVVGALTESAGLTDLLAGHPTMGLWEIWMGAILLYAGIYMLGYRRVLAPMLTRAAPK